MVHIEEPMIKCVLGDITRVKAGAVVNAANTSLLGGGGVDGAIHRAGGKAIYEECLRIRERRGGCQVGEAVITTGGNLPSKFVIHTVGPVWRGGNSNEDHLLASAYSSSLELAVENNIATIAFPNISTGIYGFPKERAAQIAIKTVKDFLERSNAIKEVIFVCFDSENYDLYNKLLHS